MSLTVGGSIPGVDDDLLNSWGYSDWSDFWSGYTTPPTAASQHPASAGYNPLTDPDINPEWYDYGSTPTYSTPVATNGVYNAGNLATVTVHTGDPAAPQPKAPDDKFTAWVKAHQNEALLIGGILLVSMMGKK